MSNPSEEIAARLKSAGQWSEFVNRRKTLTAGGMTEKDAYTTAATEFGCGDLLPASKAQSDSSDVDPEAKAAAEAERVAAERLAAERLAAEAKAREDAERQAEIQELLDREGVSQASLEELVRWALAHRSDDRVTPKNCPSTAHWEMLDFARDDRRAFWKEFAKPILARDAENDPREREEQRREKKSYEELCRVLDESLKFEDW